MNNFIVVSTLGPDSHGILSGIAGIVNDAGCSIMDSRMCTLGTECAVITLLSGPWNALAKFENTFPAFCREAGLTYQLKHTETMEEENELLTYYVQVVGLENPGIVFEIANFFAKDKISIKEQTSHTYHGSHTATLMFSINMIVTIPATSHLAELRERFLGFCDDLNLDATIEPARS